MVACVRDNWYSAVVGCLANMKYSTKTTALIVSPGRRSRLWELAAVLDLAAPLPTSAYPDVDGRIDTHRNHPVCVKDLARFRRSGS